jgi:DNA-binding MarR family transcriptional regulator
MEELEVLFNSKARPRILKLFFQNEEQSFSPKEVAKRCQINLSIIKKELEKLRKINLLQKRTSKEKVKAKRNKYFYALNPKFSPLPELRNLILAGPAVSLRELTSLFKKEGGAQLVVISGIFLKEEKSPVDILIVSKRPKKSKIAKVVKKIESQAGKEIRWSLMTIEEFNYRLEINDRFLKDIFDRKYKKIIDKLGVCR